MTKDGSRIWELFHPDSSPIKGLSVAEALVGPGRETEAHVHHASQEIYYILEGSGVMRLGKDAMPVTPGDAILILPGMPHSVKNTGAGALRIVCICHPPYSHGDTALNGL
ncbi:MAG TPA: cupin domain-containing protein [Methanocella sp.]|nr:cupin domain-containing protein [Methanocella sp.]